MALPLLSRVVLAVARPSAWQLALRQHGRPSGLPAPIHQTWRGVHGCSRLRFKHNDKGIGLRGGRQEDSDQDSSDGDDSGRDEDSHEADASASSEGHGAGAGGNEDFDLDAADDDGALLTPEEQAELDRFFRGGDGEGGDDVSLLEMGEVYAATVFLNTADRSRLTAEAIEKEARYWLPNPAPIPRIPHNQDNTTEFKLTDDALLRPKSGAHFMGATRVVFYDTLHRLERLLERLKRVKKPEGEVPPSPEKPWLSREDMARVVGADMKTKHYIMLVDVLDRLLKDPARGYIMDELSRYMRPSALAPPVAKVHVADAKGRMYATGKRKTSVARVWVGPGSGRVLINHAYLVEYFPRLTDRQAVLAPFVATETAGQFDVYATVKGGGTTGQSQALRHGIATALQRLRPDLRAPLRAKQKFGNKRYSLLTRDIRRVERKKPGQKKARKKFAWVKR